MRSFLRDNLFKLFLCGLFCFHSGYVFSQEKVQVQTQLSKVSKASKAGEVSKGISLKGKKWLSKGEEEGRARDKTFLKDAVKAFQGLLICLAFLAFIIFILKKVEQRKRGSKRGKQFLEILDTLSLGPKASIFAVEAFSKKILLSLSDGKVNFLCKIEDSFLESGKDLERGFNDYLARLWKEEEEEKRQGIV